MIPVGLDGISKIIGLVITEIDGKGQYASNHEGDPDETDNLSVITVIGCHET